VHSVTRGKNVSVEFDPFGFSIKDLCTREVIHRCESSGDLYPFRPSPPHNLSATTTVELWHQRLGHPSCPSLASILASFDFTCNKSAEHLCHAC
jgi:hypothetical protein